MGFFDSSSHDVLTLTLSRIERKVDLILHSFSVHLGIPALVVRAGDVVAINAPLIGQVRRTTLAAMT